MNNKVKQMPGDFDGFSWQYKLVGPIFKAVLAIIDTILKIEPVATKIFDNVRSEESVEAALAGVYKNPARVDDALVKSICKAAENEGALPVFVNILTGNPGPRPEELMDAVTCPIFIIWGSEDRITPLGFPSRAILSKLAANAEPVKERRRSLNSKGKDTASKTTLQRKLTSSF